MYFYKGTCVIMYGVTHSPSLTQGQQVAANVSWYKGKPIYTYIVHGHLKHVSMRVGWSVRAVSEMRFYKLVWHGDCTASHEKKKQKKKKKKKTGKRIKIQNVYIWMSNTD